MEKETLILGNNNWAVKTSNLLGYAIGETSGEYVPREFTFSRASTATYTDSNGVIQSSASNIARVQSNSLLLEPQRTNILLRSQEFDNASWSNNSRTISANVATAPDGTQTADLMYPTTTGVFRGTFQAAFPTGTYSFSVFAKASGKNFMFFYVVGASSSNGVWFDLSNGTIGTIGASWSNVQIQSFGNGWYRCSANVTLTTSPSNNLYYFISDTNNSNTATTNGTDGILLWGAQLEQGAYATTYIPTTNVNATRLADSFSRSNIYTNGYIGASGGTWYVELKNNVAYVRDVSGQGIFISTNSSGTGTGGDTFGLQNASGSSSRLTIFKRINGTYSGLFNTTTDSVKVAIKWNGSTADIFVNGTKQVSATAFTTTTMEFLNAITSDVPKFIQAMSLYNTPLTDEELILKTTL